MTASKKEKESKNNKAKDDMIKEKVEQEVLADAKSELEELEGRIEKMFLRKFEEKFTKLAELETDLKKVKERMGL